MDNTQLESQLDTRLDRQVAYREKCQRLAAGSCPAFPTLALQSPAQIFPGSDTSLALRSFLHVKRNKRRISPTVCSSEKEWILRSGDADSWTFVWKRDMHLFVKVLGKTCIISQLFGSMTLNVLQLVSRSYGEQIYLFFVPIRPSLISCKILNDKNMVTQTTKKNTFSIIKNYEH